MLIAKQLKIVNNVMLLIAKPIHVYKDIIIWKVLTKQLIQLIPHLLMPIVLRHAPVATMLILLLKNVSNAHLHA